MDYPNADRWGNPIFPDPITGEERSWTRATTVAKALDDGGGLINWTGAMVAGGCYLRNDLVGKVGARWPMTDDNKGEIYGLVQELKDAGGGSVGRNLGDTLHEMLRRILKGEDIKPMPPFDADVKAGLDLLERAGMTIRPELVERTICIPDLGIAGSCDMFADVPRWSTDELFTVDWKTGKVGSYSWAAWVAQLTIYAHATHIWDWDTRSFEAMPPVNRRRGFIASVPAGSASAQLYVVDLEPGRQAIKAALWVREWRKQAKNLARAARI